TPLDISQRLQYHNYTTSYNNEQYAATITATTITATTTTPTTTTATTTTTIIATSAGTLNIPTTTFTKSVAQV
ncbi:hypothetical protein LOAG_19000, partial [Loa loa]